MGKTGLKARDVSKDHFSSGSAGNDPKYSRLVVRIIEGRNLLASDVETGKSDPVCFIWCGYNDEQPNINHANEQDDEQPSRWLMTSVCPVTTDPVWNEDIVFPLDISDVMSLSLMRCLIFVRDEDRTEDGAVNYDDLGMIEFPMQDLLLSGRAMQTSIVRAAAWYELKKSPGMRRVDGSVKLTLSLIFSAEDSVAIGGQLDGVEGAAPPNKTLSLAQKLQLAMKAKLGKSDTGLAQGSKASVRNSNNGRPLTAGSSTTSLLSQSRPRRDASNSRGHRIQGIASPIARRPPSASAAPFLPPQGEEEEEEGEEDSRQGGQSQGRGGSYGERQHEAGEDPELIVLPKVQPVASRAAQRYQAPSLPSVVQEEEEAELQREAEQAEQGGAEFTPSVPMGDEFLPPELFHAGASLLNDLDLLNTLQDGIVQGGQMISSAMMDKVKDKVGHLKHSISSGGAGAKMSGAVRDAGRALANTTGQVFERSAGAVHKGTLGAARRSSEFVTISGLPAVVSTSNLLDNVDMPAIVPSNSNRDKNALVPKNAINKRDFDNSKATNTSPDKLLSAGPLQGDEGGNMDEDDAEYQQLVEIGQKVLRRDREDEDGQGAAEREGELAAYQAQGSTAGTVRLLREMREQREAMERLAHFTQSSFMLLSAKIKEIAEHTQGGEKAPLPLLEAPRGDEGVGEMDEEEEEREREQVLSRREIEKAAAIVMMNRKMKRFAAEKRERKEREALSLPASASASAPPMSFEQAMKIMLKVHQVAAGRERKKDRKRDLEREEREREREREEEGGETEEEAEEEAKGAPGGGSTATALTLERAARVLLRSHQLAGKAKGKEQGEKGGSADPLSAPSGGDEALAPGGGLSFEQVGGLLVRLNRLKKREREQLAPSLSEGAKAAEGKGAAGAESLGEEERREAVDAAKKILSLLQKQRKRREEKKKAEEGAQGEGGGKGETEGEKAEEGEKKAEEKGEEWGDLPPLGDESLPGEGEKGGLSAEEAGRILVNFTRLAKKKALEREKKKAKAKRAGEREGGREEEEEEERGGREGEGLSPSQERLAFDTAARILLLTQKLGEKGRQPRPVYQEEREPAPSSYPPSTYPPSSYPYAPPSYAPFAYPPSEGEEGAALEQARNILSVSQSLSQQQQEREEQGLFPPSHASSLSGPKSVHKIAKALLLAQKLKRQHQDKTFILTPSGDMLLVPDAGPSTPPSLSPYLSPSPPAPSSSTYPPSSAAPSRGRMKKAGQGVVATGRLKRGAGAPAAPLSAPFAPPVPAALLGGLEEGSEGSASLPPLRGSEIRTLVQMVQAMQQLKRGRKKRREREGRREAVGEGERGEEEGGDFNFLPPGGDEGAFLEFPLFDPQAKKQARSRLLSHRMKYRPPSSSAQPPSQPPAQAPSALPPRGQRKARTSSDVQLVIRDGEGRRSALPLEEREERAQERRGEGNEGGRERERVEENFPRNNSNNEFDFPMPAGGGDEALPPSMRRATGAMKASLAFQRSSSSPLRSSLGGRDFVETLERGSLEDVGRLIESHPPKPELLSASARNRLFDLIATLLLQGRHVERGLLWVLSLVRGKEQSIFQEVAMHTQRDLLEALQKLAQEPSKRGLLASLLNTQVNKKMQEELY